MAITIFENGGEIDRQNNMDSMQLELDEPCGNTSTSGAFWRITVSSQPRLFAIVQALDTTFWVRMLILWIILVVIDGAIWFMMIVSWIDLGDKDSNHTAMNISVHVLCGLFTYACIYNFPQRYHGLRLLCDKEAETNRDMRHRFHWIPHRDRYYIMLLLVLNCVFQFINQFFRCYYWEYTTSNRFPGTLFVNLFFVLSFAAAAWAGAWQLMEERKVYKTHADYVRERNHSAVTKTLRRESRGPSMLGKIENSRAESKGIDGKSSEVQPGVFTDDSTAVV